MGDSVASKKEQRQSMVFIVAFLESLDLDARNEPSTVPVVRAGSLIIPKSTQDVQHRNVVAFQRSNIKPSLSCQFLDLIWQYGWRFNYQL
jgi:hypothetical protein